MLNLMWGLAFVLLFLVFVIFLIIQRQRYFKYYPKNWKTVVMGGGLLVLGGSANLFLVLNQAKYASTSWLLVIHAVEIFGYVLGVSLVSIGFIQWCSSLAEGKKNATRRLRQLTCLHSLLSVINHRQELDEILKESLPDLMNIMGYKMGVIFKPTFNSSEMTVAAHGGIPPEKLYALFDLYSENTWYKESSKSKEVVTTAEVRNLPEYGTLFWDQDQIRSFACIPIKFCGKLLGLLGLYDTKLDRFSYQEIQFLTSVGEILGLSAKQNLASGRNKKRRNYLYAMENMLQITGEGTALEETFPEMAAELKRVIDFNHISLILTAGWGKDLKRISIGNSGGVLVDRRNGVPADDSVIGKVLSSKEVWVDRYIDTNENSPDDSLYKVCGIKSRIVLPLSYGDSIYGALSLGHQEPNFYSANDGKWLKAFSLTLSHLLSEQALRERLNRKDCLSRSLSEFEKRLVREEDLATLIKDVTANLTLELPRSFTRLSLLNKQGDQLISCAAHQIRSEGIELRKDDRFSLQDLPWHRLTLEAKIPMLINQEDPESFMSKREAGLIMDERINSAVLVPLILQEKAVGVVSVGEMRNWDRQPLTEEEIAFMKHRANQVCVALKKGLLYRTNEQLKERLRAGEMPEEFSHRRAAHHLLFSDFSYQINNSLTAILGSAELLKLSESNLSTRSLKYLKNIENGVDRIHKNLEEYLESNSDQANNRINPLEKISAVS